jgi:hypothetical protein
MGSTDLIRNGSMIVFMIDDVGIAIAQMCRYMGVCPLTYASNLHELFCDKMNRIKKT